MAGERYVDPDTWVAAAPHFEGSWWPAWEEWIKSSSSHEEVDPPALGAAEEGYPPLTDAPGSYVHG